MTQSEIFAFTATLKRVASVFGKRTDTEEFRGLTSSYFRALVRHEVADLERGADAWIASRDKFPKPYEWAAAIPSRVIEIPVMTDAEARTYARAESLKWEDDPCGCEACRRASVDWKPLRFVPEFTADDRDRKVRDPLRDRIVTAGHWAHGEELSGYYRAKGAFYQQCHDAGLSKPLLKIVKTIGASR